MTLKKRSSRSAQLSLAGTLLLLGTATYESKAQAQSDDAWMSESGGRISGNRAGIRVVRGAGASNSAHPVTHTVDRGETLWSISGRYFQSPYEWPRLWALNPTVTNPHWIYPNDVLQLGRGVAGSGDAGSQLARAANSPRSGTLYLGDVGFLDRDALERSGELVGAPIERMLLTFGDLTYIRLREENAARVGDEWTLFRRYEANERLGVQEGTLVRILGTIRFDSIAENGLDARATIVEALEPLERGLELAPIARRFTTTSQVPATQEVECRVVATLVPNELSGEDFMVFINKGSEDGVVVGNRVVVQRQGDTWRRSLNTSPENMGASIPTPSEPNGLRPEELAEGLVVNVRPHTSAVYLTRSLDVVEVGANALIPAARNGGNGRSR